MVLYIYFILWVTSQYYFIYFVLHIVLAVATERSDKLDSVLLINSHLLGLSVNQLFFQGVLASEIGDI